MFDIPLTEPDLYGHECCQVCILHISAMPFLQQNSKSANRNRTVPQTQRYKLACTEQLERMLNVNKKFGCYGPQISTYVSQCMNYRIVRGYHREIELKYIEPLSGRTSVDSVRDANWDIYKRSVISRSQPLIDGRIVRLVINNIGSVNYTCIPSCYGFQTPVKFHYQTFNIMQCFLFRKE